MTKIQTYMPQFDEYLENAISSDYVVGALKKLYKEVPYTHQYMELAISDQWPTFDPSEVKHASYGYDRSLAGALLLNKHSWNIVSTIFMNSGVKKHIKEFQYKNLMEMLYSGEAKVLNAVLNKSLVLLYPQLTVDTISQSLED